MFLFLVRLIEKFYWFCFMTYIIRAGGNYKQIGAILSDKNKKTNYY